MSSIPTDFQIKCGFRSQEIGAMKTCLVEKRVLISLAVDGRGDSTKVIVNYALFYTGDDKPAAHRQSCTKRIQW